MTRFRPCIDLHQGQVKQIVGGSLTDTGAATNFVSTRDAGYYAALYRQNGLQGGHLIALGPGNEEQALLALGTWRDGLQYGGGVTADNARHYLDAGAAQVIVTSYLFEGEEFSWARLEHMKRAVGGQRLVLDLSCRRVGGSWNIATNRWQTVTNTPVSADTLAQLGDSCSEFLVHAADVEGLQSGIDEALVELLGKHCPIPVTYAGGARNVDDLRRVNDLSGGRVDLTIGSALDIFGGTGVTLQECIEWNRRV